jgi:hypothetical protein
MTLRRVRQRAPYSTMRYMHGSDKSGNGCTVGSNSQEHHQIRSKFLERHFMKNPSLLCTLNPCSLSPRLADTLHRFVASFIVRFIFIVMIRP